LKLSATFEVEKAEGTILRVFGRNKGLAVTNAEVPGIIDFRINGYGIAQHADSGLQSSREQIGELAPALPDGQGTRAGDPMGYIPRRVTHNLS
jgi:hypothetical protein